MRWPRHGSPRVEMYNIQGHRYAEDNDCARLDQVGASVEVLTGSGGLLADPFSPF